MLQHKKNFLGVIFLVLCTIMLGCNTLNVHHFVRVSNRPVEIENFFHLLDEAAENAQVKQTSDFSIPGFPYLRANRFLVELGKNLIEFRKINGPLLKSSKCSINLQKFNNNDAKKELWVEAMRQLDLEARLKEIQNLPDKDLKKLFSQLDQPTDREKIILKLQNDSKNFLDHEKIQPGFYETLKTALKNIPREYSTFQRLIGIYPIFSVPVILGTRQAHREFLTWHKTPLEKLKILGTIQNFSPPQKILLSSEEISQIFSPCKRNLLGIPQLTDEEIQRLTLAFAPTYSQDTVADYDRFAEVVWKNNKVTIDTQKPTVYYYVTYALIKAQPIVQFNYVTWYTGRLGPNSPWLERGALDGITIRITLDQNGFPLMMDTMNNCGCYHFFVPRKDKIVQLIPHFLSSEPFVPAWLPESYPQKKLSLRINSGWHQLQHISVGKYTQETQRYQLLPYAVLEALPHEDGRMESVFTPEGIMKDSKRLEPLIFFSMGIPHIGFMRERGHHAISMTGETYFNDPKLFEENFVFK